MRESTRTRRPSAGTIVAVIALVFALSGAATALQGKNKVDRNDIRRGAVIGKAIHRGAVKANKLAEGAVTNSKLANGSVSNSKLATGAATNTKIADAAVTEAKLAGDAVARAKIKASAVSKPKIADGAIDDTKLADGAVTDAKVANLAFQPLTLVNGFAPNGAGFAPPSFAIDVEGIVHLRGAATQASSAGGALGTLPAAARPANTVSAAGVCVGGTPTAALVAAGPGGNVTVTALAPGSQNTCEDLGYASLDGITFPAGG